MTNCAACEDQGYLPSRVAGIISQDRFVVIHDPCPCKSGSEVLYGQLIEFKTVRKDDANQSHSETVAG